MKEKDVEKYLREQVKAAGGIAFKFVSPGNDGVPDRLVCMPGGRIFFVELKAPGSKTTAMQNRQIGRLTNLGCAVYVLDSRERIDVFIESLKRNLLMMETRQ